MMVRFRLGRSKASLAQLVEHWISNPGVIGSNPIRGFACDFLNVAEMDKALDCKSNPAKVMGSSPIVHKNPQLV
jgi:hypothetical protein